MLEGREVMVSAEGERNADDNGVTTANAATRMKQAGEGEGILSRRIVGDSPPVFLFILDEALSLALTLTPSAARTAALRLASLFSCVELEWSF